MNDMATIEHKLTKPVLVRTKTFNPKQASKL